MNKPFTARDYYSAETRRLEDAKFAALATASVTAHPSEERRREQAAAEVALRGRVITHGEMVRLNMATKRRFR